MSYSERPRVVRIPQLRAVDRLWIYNDCAYFFVNEAASGGAELQVSSEDARERLATSYYIPSKYRTILLRSFPYRKIRGLQHPAGYARTLTL